MLLGGVILFVIAAVSATGATVMQCRANPQAVVPWFRRGPPRSPWQRALSGLAGGTGVLSALLLFDTLGYWAVLAIIGAWTVASVIQYKHNRDVSRDPTTTQP